MEILRPWGIDEALRKNALPVSWTHNIIYARTLAGRELGRMRTRSFDTQRASEISPARGILSSQDVYEPIIRSLAEGLTFGELRFHTEVEDFEPRDGGVRVSLRHRDTNDTRAVQCRYLIACDGWNSSVRERLGIRMEGPAAIGHFVNVHFRADLDRWVAQRPAVLYFIAASQTRGVLQPLDGRRRWLCQISYDGSAESFASYTPERCLDWIRRAVGSSQVEAEILAVGTWTMNATVASRFRDGSVFLAGDAAHQLPPTGGFGMNTGVQDVHNLAWKLAAVLDGWAGTRLLSSYDSERRPIARFNADRSLENSRMVARINRAAATGSGDPAEAVAASRRYGNFTGMDLGFHYDEGALVPDGTPVPEGEDPVVDYIPTGRPGHRAPHVPLLRNGKEISSLDLYDGDLTLMTDGEGGAWIDDARVAAKQLRIPLQAFSIGHRGDLDDPSGRWREIYGLESGGAVLVRPDGHVAWRRARAAEGPPPVLGSVFEAVLDR